jgi:hypothetical protein
MYTFWQVGIALSSAFFTWDAEFLHHPTVEKASTSPGTWPEDTSESISTGRQEGGRNSEAELHRHTVVHRMKEVLGAVLGAVPC